VPDHGPFDMNNPWMVCQLKKCGEETADNIPFTGKESSRCTCPEQTINILCSTVASIYLSLHSSLDTSTIQYTAHHMALHSGQNDPP
jgi:hypothetical protein